MASPPSRRFRKASTILNGIGVAAAEMQQWLERSNHGFCFIGGIAVVYWGTPRSTQLDRPCIYQRLKDFFDLLENDEPLCLLEKLWE